MLRHSGDGAVGCGAGAAPVQTGPATNRPPCPDGFSLAPEGAASATGPMVRAVSTGSNDTVDRRVPVNAVQASQSLTAVSYAGSWDRCRGRRLVAFYAVLYYAGLWPADAVGLRLPDCHLPEKGWGTLTLRRKHPHRSGLSSPSCSFVCGRGLRSLLGKLPFLAFSDAVSGCLRGSVGSCACLGACRETFCC